jgi:rod shape-determining protein MreC
MPLLFSKIEDAKDHILTGVLLVTAIALMITRHEGGLQNTRILALTTLSYLEQPLSSIRIYRTALQTNRELHRENVLLLDELSRLRSAHEEIRQLKNLLEFRDTYTSPYPLIATRVAGKNLTGFRNSITIDRGSDDGVQPNMPVVNGSGLIGKVILTSKSYAQVMPVQNMLFRASASIQGTRAYGIVSWSGTSNELILNYVPKTFQISEGMIVETSSMSNHFPANIPIGVVTGTRPEPGRDTQIIFISPFANLNTLSEVFVVRYLPDEQIEALNDQFEELF